VSLYQEKNFINVIAVSNKVL